MDLYTPQRFHNYYGALAVSSSSNESSNDESFSDESQPVDDRILQCQTKLQNNELTEINCGSENDLIGVVGVLQNQPNHSSLKEISIFCMISIDVAKRIATVFKINKSIISLGFRYHTICSDGISAIVGALSNYDNTTLTKLNLSHNIIDSTLVVALSHMLKTNNTLTELRINNCSIYSAGAIVIGDALKQNAALERLNVGNNNIIDAGTIAIVDAIKENGSLSLKSLSLFGNDIGIIGANAFAALLMTNQSLTELNIAWNALNATEGIIAIAEALKQNRSLVRLEFDHLSIIPPGCDNELTRIHCSDTSKVIGLIHILRNHHSSLKELCIGCKISIENARLIANELKVNKSMITLKFLVSTISSDGIIADVEALSDYNNNTLSQLYLNKNTIDNTAVVAIGHMLKTNNSLTKLHIADCDINSDGAIVIGEALKVNTTLENLNLGSNNIGDVGAIAIANATKENGSLSLKSLDIYGNGIGTIGARSIAAMLAMNKSLAILDISSNAMIGTEGVVAIADSLKQNKSLMMLILSDNPFGDDGAKSIASMLTTNGSLKELYIHDCDMGDEGASAIAVSLRTNRSLIDLYLNSNPFSSSVIANKFAPMLEINTTLEELSYHIEQIDNVSAGAILKALQDYNDTVNVKINVYRNLDDNNDDDHDDELKLMLRKISDTSQNNCEGIRVAPFKRRRNICNDLKMIWMAITLDTYGSVDSSLFGK